MIKGVYYFEVGKHSKEKQKEREFQRMYRKIRRENKKNANLAVANIT
jgi:hypothetical protein